MRHAALSSRRRPLAPRTVTDPETGRTYAIPSGGADDGDRLEELVARIGSESDPLTAEELAEAESLATAAFDEADSDDDPDLDAMTELRDVIVAVRTEAASIAEAAEARREQAAALRSEIAVADDADEDADDEPVAEADDDEPLDVEIPDDASSIVEEESVTASVEAPAAPAAPTRPTLGAAARRRRSGSAPSPRTNGNLAVRVAGDVPGRSAGSTLSSLRDVGAAFADKAEAVMKGSGRGRYGVATFALSFPDDRMLRAGSHGQRNDEVVDAVVASAQAQSIDALVAAGGLCAPVEAAYDLEGISVESRPIRDSLVRFGAERGGIRFIEPPTLTDVAGSVGVWTEANDVAVAGGGGDPTTKPIARVTCGEEVEVTVDAITKRLEVGNFSRRTFPEQFARWWQLAGSAHSRLAEQTLYNSMVASSTAVTAPQVLGAARDVLTTIDTVVAAYRSRHRMSDNATLRVVVPSWLRELMRIDLTRQLPGDGTTNVTDAEIDAHLANRNVIATFSPDVAVFGAQGAGALLGFPTEVDLLIFHEGAFTFLDGGTLDFGMEIRDRSLNEVNDVEAFMETFENVAFRGIESLRVRTEVCATGQTSGTVDVAACTS